MQTRALLAGITALMALGAGTARAKDVSIADLLHDLQPLTNDLARYAYLTQTLPKLSASDRMTAMQLLAWNEDELGLYNEAVRHFPLVPPMLPKLVQPSPAEWKAVDAADAIATLAEKRRIVMVNEAHNDAHTRELTLALLPRLRALGFNYFAAEALGDKDPELQQRGYPVSASGSQYLREPLYGEIIRTALKLGFVVVPYDSSAHGTEEREADQAKNLYQRVFAKDPAARLFVHAGFAHIDKAKGRLGKVEPLAMRLRELTGLEPLSIDQTQFRDVNSGNELDAYHQLIANFQPKLPTVLVNRASDAAWSALPEQYDVSVIVPLEASLGDAKQLVPAWQTFGMIGISVQAPAGPPLRPGWLSLGGRRHALPIDSTTLCAKTLPCVVDAHYASEPDKAIAADRFTFVQPGSIALYLFPGSYRLRAWDAQGNTLAAQTAEVPQ